MPSAAPSSPWASRPRPAVDSTPPTTTPSRAASASIAGTGASRSARRGVRQRSSATRSSSARPGAARELRQHGQRRAADRRCGVPDQVGGQRVHGLAGDVALPDQRRQPDAGQPAGGQRGPAVGQVLLAPDVVGAGGQPLVAVRAADVEQPGGVGELQQPGGVGLADVQHAGQPLLVADPDARRCAAARPAPPRGRRAARRPCRRSPALRRPPGGPPSPARGWRPSARGAAAAARTAGPRAGAGRSPGAARR